MAGGGSLVPGARAHLEIVERLFPLDGSVQEGSDVSAHSATCPHVCTHNSPETFKIHTHTYIHRYTRCSPYSNELFRRDIEIRTEHAY